VNELICCVCHKPTGTSGMVLGGRTFCAACAKRAMTERRTVWQAGMVQIVGLLVFVALLEALVALLRPRLEGAGLIAVSVLLAIVPAVLWLAFFYQQDRLEPEPKSFVLGVFVLGLLLGVAVGLPLTRDLFRTADWLGKNALVGLLGSVLIYGFGYEFLKYVAVRYSVYGLPEFDERTDGVIYMTAAGLGLATALNMDYVLRSGGVALEVGVIQVVVTALAHASFAGITGYFLGEARFSARPAWWLPAGLALASLLQGLFTYARGEVTRTGISLAGGGGFNPWPGLALASAVAIIIFVLLNVLIRRATRATLADMGSSTSTISAGGGQ